MKANAVGWIAVLVAVAASAGAATAAALVTTPPGELRSAPKISQATVGSDAFDDSRRVELAVKSATPVHLFAPTNGKLTAFACEQGATINSGDAPV